jgi:hypothetical protein
MGLPKITFETKEATWSPTGAFNTETDDGPLSSLSRNPFQTQNLTYPRDLISNTKKGHSVQFAISKIDNKSIEDTFNSIKDKTIEAYKAGKAELEKDASLAATALDVNASAEVRAAAREQLGQSLLDQLQKGANQIVEGSIKASKPTYTSLGTTEGVINLYMPDTADFQQSAHYNQIGVLEAAASVPFLGKPAGAILSTLQNQQARLTLNSMGYVFNPQEQVIFEGIDFRTFDMSFTFTPYSSKESEEVKKIIKLFRKSASPTIQTGVGGFFFIPPSVFDISFKKDGIENININKLKRCVLTSVTVNYAPNGTWSTYEDGMPVQTNLNLSFKEIELVDSAAIDKDGY